MSKMSIKYVTLVSFAITILGINGCSMNTDTQTTSSSSPTGTRPATDSSENWTDTPANQAPPNLGSEPAVGAQYCSQDKDYIYGSASGCLFSIENYNDGNIQTLTCHQGSPYIDGKLITDIVFDNLSLTCE